MNDYKYDLAMSFLAEDEGLAQQIADNLSDRVTVFIYSQNQEELVGTDGVESFSKVFAEESRLVVVLHRPAWGQTKWTTVEETAIRGRGYEHGFDFLQTVVLQKPPKLPPWMPKTQIWHDLERWGVEGLSAVIESRIQSLGGETVPITVIDKGALADRQLIFQEERKQWRETNKGVDAVRSAVKDLCLHLQKSADTISGKSTKLKFDVENDGRGGCILRCNGMSLLVKWESVYANVLDGSFLDVRVFRGSITFRAGQMYIHDPVTIDEILFNADLNRSRNVEWSQDEITRKYTTEQLSEYCLTFFMDHLKKKQCN